MNISREVLEERIRKAIELKGDRNFKQSVEAIIVLRHVDMKQLSGKIREQVVLPKGRGKDLDICVVADGEMAIKAREAGASMVLTSSDLQGLSKKDARRLAEKCDWFLVRTDLMGLAGRVLGPALGPRGKVPVPIAPSADVASMIRRYKNTVLVRIRDQPHIAAPIGTEDMNPSDLAENALAVLSAVEPKLPNGFANIAKIVFKTTMGVPVEVNL